MGIYREFCYSEAISSVELVSCRIYLHSLKMTVKMTVRKQNPPLKIWLNSFNLNQDWILVILHNLGHLDNEHQSL